MSLWIAFTLAAALFQAVRFMLQRQLAMASLSAGGATFARFLYSAPIVACLAVFGLWQSGLGWPATTPIFWLACMVGGLAQVLATIAVVRIFKARNFAVGITFAKTEVVMSVLVGMLVLGEGVSWGGFAAIALGIWGVILLSVPPEKISWRGPDLVNPVAGLGLASGLCFAVSAVCYRLASLEIEFDSAIARAGVTLAAVTALQMTGMFVWLGRVDPEQIATVWRERGRGIWVGLLSMAGSFCWFSAFTLQNAAYVKAVGQVELIICALVSLWIFREPVTRREWTGMTVLVVSILALLAALA